MYEYLSKAAKGDDVPSIKSLQTEQANLHCIISEVATKIEALISQNTSLHNQIQTTSESFTKISNTKPLKSTEPVAMSANSIADELADRKRREANVVVYNLTELSDNSRDRSQFVELCDKVFSIKVGIIKSVRLGKHQENKARPFLITLETICDKETITSRSYLLRNHEQYKNVFITSDMTKYQRHKHKQLVEELKRRRTNEPNLVIRDGIIVTRTTRLGHTGGQMDTNTSTPSGDASNNS